MPSNCAPSVTGCRTSNLTLPQHARRTRCRRWMSFGVSVMAEEKMSREELRKHIEQAAATMGRSVNVPPAKGSANGGSVSPEAKGKQPLHDWDSPDWSILDDRRGELPEFPLDCLSPPPGAWG